MANKEDKAFWRAIYGLRDARKLTERDIEMLERMQKGEDVIDWKQEIESRWENFREIIIQGNSVEVIGNTYPVRRIMKDWAFKWADCWFRDLDGLSAKQVLKLAYEIGAEIKIKEVPAPIWSNLIRANPHVEEVYKQLTKVAERDESEAYPMWRISVDKVVKLKKQREMGAGL